MMHAKEEEKTSPHRIPAILSGSRFCGTGATHPIETMKTKYISQIGVLLALGLLTPVVTGQEKEAKKETVIAEVKEIPEPGTIAAGLRDGATFSIFTKAVRAAELDLLLGTKGAYTVFAPTDEAFTKLPEGTLDKLMLPENKEKLRSLLLYHVIPGIFTSSDLKDGELKTSNGEKVEIDIEGKTVEVEDSKVSKADLVLSNGVVHSIDKVMVPKSLDGFAGLDED
jgi:uncharacterized surface protein with fasciclin (FAS1) repeats